MATFTEHAPQALYAGQHPRERQLILPPATIQPPDDAFMSQPELRASWPGLSSAACLIANGYALHSPRRVTAFIQYARAVQQAPTQVAACANSAVERGQSRRARVRAARDAPERSPDACRAGQGRP